MKKITTEEFIERAKLKHGDRYDYSLSVYTGGGEKLKIICKEHGVFFQKPDKHLLGQGCRKCSGCSKLSTELFIERAISVHGYTFDYSNVKYKSNKDKVKIICKIHGEFEQTSYLHLKGHGCKKCSFLSLGKEKAYTTDFFLKKAKEKHGDKYDYSKVEYYGTYNKVEIICKKHGSFFQTPNSHLTGRGCNDCGYDLTSAKLTRSTSDFIERAVLKHGYIYDYSLIVYSGRDAKVKIICKKHGVFESTAGVHLQGSGCHKCSGYNRRITTTDFIKRAINRHGDAYDYSSVIYDGIDNKVEITCKSHGIFKQIAYGHLQGKGCPSCADRWSGRRPTTNEFIDKAKEVHGDTFDYSNVDYVNAHKKIKIICKIHGEFKQTPDSHLSGRGCAKCSLGNISKPEIDLVNLIKAHGLEVFANKSINKGKGNIFRFDCVIPSKKVVIEFNGLYWHSTANKHETYHQEKREHAEKNGYRLITIWEDEWLNNKKAVNTKIIKILSGKEDVARGKEIVLDLDYQCYKKYLRNGYKITSIAPVARRRLQSSKKRHVCFNSAVAVLQKA
jgi:very-short-patch-repair endonuclease